MDVLLLDVSCGRVTSAVILIILTKMHLSLGAFVKLRKATFTGVLISP